MDRCDDEVFKRGVPLLLADTFRCGAAGFELWVQRVAQESGQRVDWHYSGGVAHVLVLGDHALAKAAAGRLLPCPARIMQWCEPGEGIYRHGVDAAPPGAVAFYLDPVSGKTAFIVEPVDAQKARTEEL